MHLAYRSLCWIGAAGLTSTSSFTKRKAFLKHISLHQQVAVLETSLKTGLNDSWGQVDKSISRGKQESGAKAEVKGEREKKVYMVHEDGILPRDVSLTFV